MKPVYIFSGLGADKRVFQYMDLSGLDVVFIEWIIPYKQETIEEYALRLTEQIKSPKPVLIGFSLSGIMAIEVAKIIETEKIILMATAQTKHELPFYYRLAGKLRLHKFIPPGLLMRSNFFINWLFGTESATDKKLLSEIIHDTDPAFLNWAIEKTLLWKNIVKHKNTVHIHGTADRILPIRFVRADVKVNAAGHFMTVNRHKEISALIRNELK